MNRPSSACLTKNHFNEDADQQGYGYEASVGLLFCPSIKFESFRLVYNEQLIGRKTLCGGRSSPSYLLRSKICAVDVKDDIVDSSIWISSPAHECSLSFCEHQKWMVNTTQETILVCGIFFVQRFHWLWKFDHNKSIAEWVGWGNHWYS